MSVGGARRKCYTIYFPMQKLKVGLQDIQEADFSYVWFKNRKNNSGIGCYNKHLLLLLRQITNIYG